MATEAELIEQLTKEVAYFKKRSDELAGENVNITVERARLHHELKKKKKGFELLSKLQQTIGSKNDIKAIYLQVIEAINTGLGMDRTIFLSPTPSGTFKPSYLLGYLKDREADILNIELQVPQDLAKGEVSLAVNKATRNITPFIDMVQTSFELPYFACLSVHSDKEILGFLISGRNLEQHPLYPPIDEGDLDTFESIAGLVAATVENMKVAALIEMDRMKTDFFANISHEFRTPITLTLGPLDSLINGRHGALSAPVLEQLRVMQRNQGRLLNLINQILDLAKLESGGMLLTSQKITDLNSWLDKTMDQFQSMADSRGLKIRKVLDENVNSAEIYLDVEKFDKIIFNLLSNAFKFTKSGSVELTSRIEGNKLNIAVRDTGMGIRADQIDKIFDRFKQAEGSMSKEHAGTGIGLSLVKELVSIQHGSIEVRSTYGSGTEFTLSFPLGHQHLAENQIVFAVSDKVESNPLATNVFEGTATESENAEVSKINKNSLDNYNTRKDAILYVDDNRDLRNFVYSLLVEKFNVFLAVDGADGFQKLSELPTVDLILSDLMMPKLTGTELLKKVRENSQFDGIPFVILTAKAGLNSKIEGLDQGADDYLNKPFSEEELMARIRNLLKIRQQQLRIRKELQAAREIQKSLLPRGPHFHTSFMIDAYYKPCEELSGDFFDWIQKDNYIYYFVADVTSHGTAAAQVTYIVKEIIHQLIEPVVEPGMPAELMKKFSVKYAGYGLEYAVGLQIFRLDPIARELIYSQSNSPLMIHIKSGAAVYAQMQSNPMIMAQTLRGDETFTETIVKIESDTDFFCFTDGCYEFSRNATGGELGIKGFSRLLKSLPKTNWQDKLMEGLSMENGSDSFPDDITVVRLSIT